MKHSKQLVVLVSTVLVAAVIGTVTYLCLYNQEQLIDSPAANEVEIPVAVSDQQNSEAEIRARLEATMSTNAVEITQEEEKLIIERLRNTMSSSTPESPEDKIIIQDRLNAEIN